MFLTSTPHQAHHRKMSHPFIFLPDATQQACVHCIRAVVPCFNHPCSRCVAMNLRCVLPIRSTPSPPPPAAAAAAATSTSAATSAAQEMAEEEENHKEATTTNKSKKKKSVLRKSCNRCFRMKVRCDNNRPCERCVMRGLEDECIGAEAEDDDDDDDDDETKETVTKPKPRTRLSCDQCFRKHASCDNNRPCGLCIKDGVEDECAGTESTSTSKAKTKTKSPKAVAFELPESRITDYMRQQRRTPAYFNQQAATLPNLLSASERQQYANAEPAPRRLTNAEMPGAAAAAAQRNNSHNQAQNNNEDEDDDVEVQFIKIVKKKK
jgi:hypothetical protein